MKSNYLDCMRLKCDAVIYGIPEYYDGNFRICYNVFSMLKSCKFVFSKFNSVFKILIAVTFQRHSDHLYIASASIVQHETLNNASIGNNTATYTVGTVAVMFVASKFSM